jgi:hypothetical protein
MYAYSIFFVHMYSLHILPQRVLGTSKEQMEFPEMRCANCIRDSLRHFRCTHKRTKVHVRTHPTNFFNIILSHLLSLPPSLPPFRCRTFLIPLSLLDPDKFGVCKQEASAEVKRSALAYLEGLVVNKVESLRISSISPKYCTSCHTNLLCQH